VSKAGGGRKLLPKTPANHFAACFYLRSASQVRMSFTSTYPQSKPTKAQADPHVHIYIHPTNEKSGQQTK
jgi:hypothetical protein